MSLREYLFYKKMTAKEFAKKARISTSYLTFILCGKFWPSNKILEDIEAATNGVVTRDTLLVDQYGPEGRLTGAQRMNTLAESNMSMC